MDEFLQDTRERLPNKKHMEDLAYKYIIKIHMLDGNNSKSQKILEHDDLDDDLEDSFFTQDKDANDIVPGNIYIFIYNPKSLIEIKTNGITFSFADKMPILFCTETNGEKIKGINLNYCPFAVKTCILNEIVNMDSKFYDKINPSAAIQANTNKNPISKVISIIFGSKKKLDEFYAWMDHKYKLKRNDIVYRSYDINRIKNIKKLDSWTWKYLPFLNFKAALKTTELINLQKEVTGEKNSKKP